MGLSIGGECYMNQQKIILYEADTTNFDNNGDYILDNIIMDDEISWGLFDQWSFSFSVPLLNEQGLRVERGQIIKVPTPNFEESQLFYVIDIERDLFSQSVTAIHVHNKVKNIYLPASLIRDRTLSEAANQILIRDNYFNFTFYTDKPQARIDTNFVRVNALQAIADETMDNSLITQSQTEFTANNFELQLVSRIGKDRGVDLRYGRDLLRFVESEDSSEITGRIVPTGKDGFTIPEHMGGPYVSLSDINELEEDYDPRIHLTREVEFSDIIANYGENEGDENALPIAEAVRQLKRLGEREFTLRQIHKPILSYDVDFIALEHYPTSRKQKEILKELQTIKAGDTITIIDRDNTQIKERMIGYSYSPLKEEYTSITLANKSPKITAEERAKKRVLGGGTMTL